MARTTTQLEAVPYWSASASVPHFPKLDHTAKADVVVVGGGMTGLTTAYLLTKAGRKVILLERGRLAQVDSGHTSAHLTMVTDMRLKPMADRFGASHAQAVWDAGLNAIAQIESIVNEHEIACSFARVDGFLHVPDGERDDRDVERLKEEVAIAEGFGFDAAFVESVPVMGTPGIQFAGQARFHPRAYAAGLAQAIVAMGGVIHEQSAPTDYKKKPLGLEVHGHTVECEHLVIATHDPLYGVSTESNAARLQMKLALYSSYVIAGRVAKGSVPDALFWDTADPYHYLRIDPHRDFDVVVFGGEDHKTGQETDTEARYTRLEQKIKTLVPDVQLANRWSGQVIATPDGLPFIGQTAPNQYAATGFNGNGLTFGTLGAMIITDAITGRRNPWRELFEMDRPAIRRGLWDYIKENADYPYYKIRERFAGAEHKPVRSIPRGHGKILEIDGRKVAAYRNDAGDVSLVSATCTHMGCVVAWNPAERTWDCPCHGSRFKPSGAVISGPAEQPLKKIER